MKRPLTNIHSDAKIADSAIIEPFASIHKDVIIGERTHIHSNVVIMAGAVIGNDVTIFPGAVISAMPQDLKYKGEKTGVEIGDGTIIREFVTVNRGTAAKMKTIVGKKCLLMAYSHVAHDCILGNNIILANTVQLAGEVEVDDFAILGGGTLVHQFTRIGTQAMTQGGLLLGKDIPPFVKAAREPASFAGVNSIGLRRSGYSNEKINHIQDIYRLIFSSGLNNKDAVIKLENDIEESEEKQIILTFIKASNRGIIPSYNSGK
ncbi:MAG: acyl-ACP--UDP-N-acetylglucosamine O-acyltransferase [Bacteroidales bacterium]|nr:acyl-ACP--UDP-N-acetylglucosamine O-acyltransferase [Bacteroidales bacterium]